MKCSATCLENPPYPSQNICLIILARVLTSPFVHGRCKTPIEEIQAAVDGAISKEQAIKLRQCLEHIDQLEGHKQSIKDEILTITKSYSETLELLRTIPGFDKNPMTAITVLSEIGSDVTVFPTAKHLCSWAGCCPRNDQSNQKVKCRRISQAGTYLKPILVQIANALIKSKSHTEFIERYRRLKARRGHKKAIIAICKMLLTAIWNILSKHVPYTNEGYFTSSPNIKKDKVLTTTQALTLLRLRGYTISDDNSHLTAS